MMLQLGLTLVLILAVIVGWRFLLWKENLVRQLNQQSSIVRTLKGPIEYQIIGESGEFVLFLHGTPGGYDQYAMLANLFFANFRVISISRFGYLRTPLTAGMNLPDQADAVAAFLDELKLHKVNVVAGSGGGPLALAFAAYHPKRVKRLVLYAAVSQAHTVDDNRPGVKLLKAITRSDFFSWLFFVPLMRKPEKVVRMLIKNEKDQSLIIQKGLVPQFAQSLSTILPPSLRNPGMANDERIIKNLDIPKQLIIAPTLIVHGDKDEHVAYEQSKRLKEQVRHAKMITIEGGDHFAGYIHSDYLRQVYQDFFAATVSLQ